MERPRLSVSEQGRLADALLACACVRDRGVRDQVLATLSSAGIDHLEIPRQRTDRADVIGIINALVERPGGLIALLECVELFEPGTVAVIHLRELVGRLEPDPLLSPEQHSSLAAILSTVVCPDPERLYWEAVGPFGPPPTGTRRDLVSLVRDLGDVMSADALPPLLKFLVLLAAEQAPVQRADLRRWVEAQVSRIHVHPPELPSGEPPPAAPVTGDEPGQAYLILQMDHYGAEPDRYLLSAWFRHGSLSLVLRGDEEPIAVEQLPEQLDFLLTRDPEVTRSATSGLVVELILPRRLITADVDQWPIVLEGFARPVGTEHPLVVRPLERHRWPALRQHAWRRKWDWLRTHGHDPGAVIEAVHWIREPTGDNSAPLMIKLQSTDPPVCICLAFAPQQAHELGAADAYAVGVHAGAPVVLWCRDGTDTVNLEQEILRLLRGRGLMALPELVYRYRQQAHFPGAPDTHLGRHLTLLWDDHDRRPEFDNLLAPMRGTR